MDRKPIRDIVKDQRWQKVRESLLNQWKERPTWCCEQLKKYLGKLTSATIDELRIVGNYLVSSGFRTGRINYKCAIELRHKVFSELKRRKIQHEMFSLFKGIN